jgi:trans-aconitate methyltransferase
MTTFAETAAFFDALVERHGDDPRASDWGSDASQRLRFEAVAGVADLSGLRVLDVGCGVARFSGFLAERCPGVDYVGIDLSARAIEAARRLRPGLDLRVANVLDLDPGRERFDIVVANGILYRLPHADDAWALVERLWQLAGTAVAVTSLSTWADERPAHELHLDPAETLARARTLTPRATLRHDYLPHDFVLYLYREGASR